MGKDGGGLSGDCIQPDGGFHSPGCTTPLPNPRPKPSSKLTLQSGQSPAERVTPQCVGPVNVSSDVSEGFMNQL